MSEALAISSVDLRTVFDRARFDAVLGSIGRWQLDLLANTIACSEGCWELLQVSCPGTLHYDDFLLRVAAIDRDRLNRAVRESLLGEDGLDIECRVGGDSSQRWIAVRGRVERNDAGAPSHVAGVLQDVSTRKQAEQKRDELRRRLFAEQEAERLRLGRELHREAGKISDALLALESLEPLVREGGSERLLILRDQLKLIVRNLQGAALELRPIPADDVGISRVLADHLQEWGSRLGIEVLFDCRDPDIDRLPEAVRFILSRILQEIAADISKRALDRSTARVVIERAATSLILTYEEDGLRFASKSLSSSNPCEWPASGSAALRERLLMIGEELKIDQSAGAGTRLVVQISFEVAASLQPCHSEIRSCGTMFAPGSSTSPAGTPSRVVGEDPRDRHGDVARELIASVPADLSLERLRRDAPSDAIKVAPSIRADGHFTRMIADTAIWGCLFVNADREVLFMNRAARRMVAGGHGIALRDDRVRLNRAASDRALRHLVTVAVHTSAQGSHEGGAVGAVSVLGAGGCCRHALQVFPGGSFPPGCPLALVIVSDLDYTQGPDRSILAELFSLSKKEAELAEMLARGVELNAAAATLHISINTVRVHLHNIFNKTGAANQVVLARLLARLSLGEAESSSIRSRPLSA